MSIVSSRKMARQGAQPSRSVGHSTLYLWLIGAALLFVILLVVVIKFNNPQPAATIAQPDLPAAWIDRTTLGNPDAKVIIEAYEDFLCPNCRVWHNTVQPQLLEEYIKPGKVRLVFHNFPLTKASPGPQMAALASQCAADQNAFWPYHDQLFAVQRQGEAAFRFEQLVAYADQLGLMQSQFTHCLSSFAHQVAVDSAVQSGLDRGVTGTPTFFLNGQAVGNDYAVLKAAIEQQLATGKES